jgi:hypothetical protein
MPLAFRFDWCDLQLQAIDTAHVYNSLNNLFLGDCD